MIDEDRKFKAFPKDIYIICLELQRSWAHGTNNDLQSVSKAVQNSTKGTPNLCCFK